MPWQGWGLSLERGFVSNGRAVADVGLGQKKQTQSLEVTASWYFCYETAPVSEIVPWFMFLPSLNGPRGLNYSGTVTQH